MKRWYVVQVYTGYEEMVKADLQKRIEVEGLQDSFGTILVPVGTLATFFGGNEPEQEKILPGYVLIQMEMAPETFQVVKAITRVVKFLGGSEPVPLSQREVERLLSQVSGEISVSRVQVPFVVGNVIHISGGPFAGFEGIIDSIDEVHEKLTVMVSIFGRHTPIELGFDQVHA